MHGDLVKNNNNIPSKTHRGLGRLKITPESPPSSGAKQVLYLAVFGCLGALLGIAVWLELVAGLLFGIMIALWIASIPCAVVGLWRGKFELAAIARGHSPVRGKTFAHAGFFVGVGALVIDAILIILFVIGAFGGSEEIVAESATEVAARKYMTAIIDDDFDTYRACLSAKQLEMSDTIKAAEFEARLKAKFDSLHLEDFADMKLVKVKIEPISEIRAKAIFFLKGTKDKNDESTPDRTLVKEGDDWKVE